MKRSSGSDPERDRRRPAGSGHEDDAAVGSRSRLQGGKLSRKQLLHFTAILQVGIDWHGSLRRWSSSSIIFRKRVTGVSFPYTHTMSALSELSLPSRARNGWMISPLCLCTTWLGRFVSEIPFHRELQQPRAIQRIDDKQRAESLPRDQVAVLVWDLAVSTG